LLWRSLAFSAWWAALAFASSHLQAANQPPELAPIADQTVNEQETLTFTPVATDPDLPLQHLTFRLGAGAFTGATIDTNTGFFSWTPTEGHGPGTTPFSIIVTDDGSPSLSATQRFTVFVLEVNRAPTLLPVVEQTANEGELLVVSVLAEDPDLPLQNLSFSLGANAPAGASITAGGLFTWTPDETQGPGTNLITVIVADDGVPSLTATQRFNVVVKEVNRAPSIPEISGQAVNEGEPLSFAVPAVDPDVPAQTLTFSLGANAPGGASINPVTGVFTWTPTEAQGPATHFVSVVVTDNGTPNLSGFQSFVVVVHEVNQPPAIASIPDQSIGEGELLVFIVAATDPDLPAQSLTFRLGADAPTGASISPDGLFIWSPDEAQGPGTNAITVIVADNGSPSLSATQRFTAVVAERNRPPELPPIAEQSVNEGELLSFIIAATDPDLPAQRLTFTLGAGAADGANIDPATGLFTWRPTEAQGPATNSFSVLVADNGVPSLNAARSFTIVVREVNQRPVLAPVADQTVRKGDLLVFTVAATDPDVPAQRLSFSLGNGAPSGAGISPEGLFTWTPGTTQAAALYQIAIIVADDGSPVLSATNVVRVTVTDGTLTAPVLQSPSYSATTFSTRINTLAGRTYFLERTISLSPLAWGVVGQVQGNGATLILTDVTATNRQCFYRARVE
jgi:hypothetical protein